MKICLNTHNLAGKMNVDEIIAVCKAAGVQGVEFSIGYGHEHGVEFDTPKADLIKTRDKILDAGLETVSIASYCRFDSDSERERDKNLDLAMKGIDVAAVMKAGIFRFVGNDLPPNTSRDTFLERMATVMTELAHYADQHNAPTNITAPICKVLLQIHGTLCRAPDLAEICRLCSRPYETGLVYNCDQGDVAGGSVDAYLGRVAQYVKHVHMHCMLLDYPYGEMFSILKKAGYEGWDSIVVDEPSLEPQKVSAYYAKLAKTLYEYGEARA
jgi:sugar phosphate isomerase/epimerase